MSNLTPEQRPDKNGNIVTRWVRGMFKAKEPERTIPKVTIDVSPKHPVTNGQEKREAKELYLRLMETMPDGDKVELLATGDEEEKQVLRKLDDRDVLEGAFENRDYDLLPAFEKFGDAHGYRNVQYAARLIRSDGSDLSALTGEQISAYVSIRSLLREKILEEQKWKDTGYSSGLLDITLHTPDYVFWHPEDGTILEGILRRGVTDRDEMMKMLKDIKGSPLAPAISDGFL